MIGTLLRIAWSSFKRDRASLFLTFALPIIFFSIFSWIFGSMSGGGGGSDLPSLEILVLDLDQSAVSAKLIQKLAEQEALEITDALEQWEKEGSAATGDSEREGPPDREAAFRQVRLGRSDAAIVIPAGFSDNFGSFIEGPSVELIYDASNPMAQHTISGLLQAASFSAAPSHLMRAGMGMLEANAGPLTAAQEAAVEQFEAFLESDEAGSDGTGQGGVSMGLISVDATAAHDDSDDGGPPGSIVAYYAAGIGVMFLLFSVTGAASGLLEEEQTGTLERLLTSNVGMGTVLLSNWTFFSLMGLAQVIVMFVWGALVFGLDLFTANHLIGFLTMAIVTAGAASAFALVLATACKTRSQLNGLSTITILIMSAIGGSMIPRFIMPPFMDTAAKFTFNGWALDGFLKVFWYDDPEATMLEALVDLWPQVTVLGVLACVFLGLASFLGRRWEAA